MIIRNKKESDIESIAKVHYESWVTTYKGIVPDSYLDSLSLESYIEKHHMFNAPCIVAEVDGKVVGFLMYSKDKDEDTSDKCGEIMVIYLLQEYQHKGIGTLLMNEAEKRMKSEFDQLSLWVLEDNIPTVKFYEKMGFEKDGKYELEELGNVLRETRMIKNI
ncbi:MULTISPECIES: GNAT family N-acetyltransferase [Mammaliicoccus]|uniref:GNAT family N-acetyltransferase n=1 Tax=Mammaliicoccus TaxID=2803850 RepID=UPI0009924286|nr:MULTISPECIES: GNAT family N-acetyltransferase [Mammaliicoccus]MBO3061480.1 GNAT family N-acetyltransferase [Mammaliicoccus fleurettii]MBW0765529.1 GNAT family N-acetyltransferase [Mammaliicoccus fleurettii]MEB6201751.1 GNAT family N-acetyltransferase [Mammaliicoccus fleurettii]MEB7724150.1 GNAT family N-acetyltransferase [Mammaliicoccus fleurettii]MEB8068511.1 GNAT family N-acetyltransferase [Mammaliicoccus fleurettii]